MEGLSALERDYDVLLCDVWGVVHDGERAFAGPCAALSRWRAEVGPVVLVSNSPRRAAEVAAQMDSFLVPRSAWSALATSGDATRTLLAERAPGPAWHLGPERDRGLFEGLGLELAGPDEAAFIACTGLFHDEREGPEDYRETLAGAAARGLAMVCANPDFRVQRGSRLIWCAGALADLYARLGGEVLLAGKPHAPIYQLALSEAGRLLGAPVRRERVLAVGDGAATDIAGANRAGIDALFVTGGVHQDELTGRDPAAAAAFLARFGAASRYVTHGLAW